MHESDKVSCALLKALLTSGVFRWEELSFELKSLPKNAVEMPLRLGQARAH